MKKVVVASKNPVKIESARRAFTQMMTEEFEFVGVDAESGVPDQPMTNEETFRGAMNRAENVSKIEEADYWVGIEGGLEEKNGEMEAFAWIVVMSKEGKIGKARSASFILPKKLAVLIKEGMELGDADDKVFGLQNSKQKSGTVGTLTKEVMNRTDFYESTAILALIPFVNEELY
jgi:inosine/xanthosine triphosphatase